MSTIISGGTLLRSINLNNNNFIKANDNIAKLEETSKSFQEYRNDVDKHLNDIDEKILELKQAINNELKTLSDSIRTVNHVEKNGTNGTTKENNKENITKEISPEYSTVIPESDDGLNGLSINNVIIAPTLIEEKRCASIKSEYGGLFIDKTNSDNRWLIERDDDSSLKFHYNDESITPCEMTTNGVVLSSLQFTDSSENVSKIVSEINEETISHDSLPTTKAVTDYIVNNTLKFTLDGLRSLINNPSSEYIIVKSNNVESVEQENNSSITCKLNSSESNILGRCCCFESIDNENNIIVTLGNGPSSFGIITSVVNEENSYKIVKVSTSGLHRICVVPKKYQIGTLLKPNQNGEFTDGIIDRNTFTVKILGVDNNGLAIGVVI